MRKSKTIGSNTLTYYYNGDNLINESLNGSNTTSYLMGADGYICRKRSTAYEYYLKDAPGDVVYGMNQNGGRIGQYSYNAWGEYETEYSYYSEIYRSPIRYSGQYYDYESGMTYLRARYYDPQLRRFISEDPIKDGLNWYAYCGNNPVMFVDPWGLFRQGDQYLSSSSIAKIFLYTMAYYAGSTINDTSLMEESRNNADSIREQDPKNSTNYALDSAFIVANGRNGLNVCEHFAHQLDESKDRLNLYYDEVFGVSYEDFFGGIGTAMDIISGSKSETGTAGTEFISFLERVNELVEYREKDGGYIDVNVVITDDGGYINLKYTDYYNDIYIDENYFEDTYASAAVSGLPI